MKQESFSDTARETMNDKILHLIQNEAVTNADDCGTMNIPQMTQPLEGVRNEIYLVVIPFNQPSGRVL